MESGRKARRLSRRKEERDCIGRGPAYRTTETVASNPPRARGRDEGESWRLRRRSLRKGCVERVARPRVVGMDCVGGGARDG